MLGRVPFVSTGIATGGSLFTILDTGANDDIINGRDARDLGLKVRDPQLIEQPGGAIEMGRIDSVPVRIGDAGFSLPLISAPLDPLQKYLGQPFDVILGYGFFKQYVVEFDYADAVIRLYDPNTYAAPSGFTELPLIIRNKSPLVAVEFILDDGREVKGLLEIDTGSFEALGLSGNFVDAAKLVAANAPRIKLFGLAIGGETSGYRARIRQMRLGTFSLDRPVVSVTTSANAGRGISDVAGVLGGEALRRFDVVVDYTHSRLLLKPNRNYGVTSEYFDFLGAQIVAEGADFHNFVVTNVMESSPAAEAGLRAADQIITIDGRAGSTLSLNEVMGIFGRPGQTHELSVRRNGEVLTLHVTTRRLI